MKTIKIWPLETTTPFKGFCCTYGVTTKCLFQHFVSLRRGFLKVKIRLQANSLLLRSAISQGCNTQRMNSTKSPLATAQKMQHTVMATLTTRIHNKLTQ
jgi:hypothetical protein